jgi:hypothetical protein
MDTRKQQQKLVIVFGNWYWKGTKIKQIAVKSKGGWGNKGDRKKKLNRETDMVLKKSYFHL